MAGRKVVCLLIQSAFRLGEQLRLWPGGVLAEQSPQTVERGTADDVRQRQLRAGMRLREHRGTFQRMPGGC